MERFCTTGDQAFSYATSNTRIFCAHTDYAQKFLEECWTETGYPSAALLQESRGILGACSTFARVGNYWQMGCTKTADFWLDAEQCLTYDHIFSNPNPIPTVPVSIEAPSHPDIPPTEQSSDPVAVLFGLGGAIYLGRTSFQNIRSAMNGNLSFLPKVLLTAHGMACGVASVSSLLLVWNSQ